MPADSKTKTTILKLRRHKRTKEAISFLDFKTEGIA